jgi:hypothetical protein
VSGYWQSGRSYRALYVKEFWTSIEGTDGRYEVSNLGRVRSLFGRVRTLISPRILKPRLSRKGYLRVQFTIRLQHSDHYIHRLVAREFIPNPSALPYVNHLDGNPRNNQVTNLQWCTQKQNIEHALATGLMRNQAGEGNHAGSKLTNTDVILIRKLHSQDGVGVCDLARQFNVSHSLISSVASHKVWKHVQ